MSYKTPQEAIDACESECKKAWEAYLKQNNLNPSLAPEACAAAERVFRHGYLAGAAFVSNHLIQRITHTTV